MWPFRRKDRSPNEVSRELRESALSLSAEDSGVAANHSRETVWVLLMETGYAKAVASLVCIADGTTSIYFSNGGGMIGAGERESVRLAADAFRIAASRSLPLLAPAADQILPAVGMVRFYARTDNGLMSAEAEEKVLASREHALSPLFFAGHMVITAIRESTATK